MFKYSTIGPSHSDFWLLIQFFLSCLPPPAPPHAFCCIQFWLHYLRWIFKTTIRAIRSGACLVCKSGSLIKVSCLAVVFVLKLSAGLLGTDPSQSISSSWGPLWKVHQLHCVSAAGLPFFLRSFLTLSLSLSLAPLFSASVKRSLLPVCTALLLMDGVAVLHSLEWCPLLPH